MTVRVDDRSRLVRALALSRRFHLYLVVCDSPRAADQLVPWLSAELQKLRKRPVQLLRLDPYPTHKSVEALAPAALYDLVLRPLLEPPEEARAPDLVHIVDVSRATSRDHDAWMEIFQRWNEKRNAMQTLLGGEVVVLLPPEMGTLFAIAAPDVWSIRSGEYKITENPPIIGDVLVVATAVVPAESIGPFSRPAAEWLLYPRLTLWGGDLVVEPWLPTTPASFAYSPSEHDRTRGFWMLQEGESLLARREFAAARAHFAKGLQTSDADIPRFRGRMNLGLSMSAIALDAAEEAELRALAIPQDCVEDTELEAALSLARWALGIPTIHSAPRVRSLNVWLSHQLMALDSGGQPVPLKDRVGDPLDDQVVARTVADMDEPARTRWQGRLGELESNRLLLRGDTRAAREAILRAQSRSYLNVRANMSLAFYDLVQGDETAAESMLSSIDQRFDPPVIEDSNIKQESNRRLMACVGHTRGVFHLTRQEPGKAERAFTQSEKDCEQWARYGFDRRANKRAWAAARLGRVRAIGLQPGRRDEAVVLARELAEWVTALLPADPRNDLVTVALAIETHRELASLRADKEPEASRTERGLALDLATHLSKHAVPQWAALAATTEREAARH